MPRFHVAHGQTDHVVLGDHVGVEPGGAVVAAAPDADVAHAALAGLGKGQLNGAAGDGGRHAVAGVDDRPGRPLGNDSLSCGRDQAASPRVLHEAADLPGAVREGSPRVGGDEDVGTELGVFLGETGIDHGGGAETLEVIRSDAVTSSVGQWIGSSSLVRGWRVCIKRFFASQSRRGAVGCRRLARRPLLDRPPEGPFHALHQGANGPSQSSGEHQETHGSWMVVPGLSST